MKSLIQKRKQSTFIILAMVFGSAAVAATPKVNLDSAKQIFLTVANVSMCLAIWDIYFEESLYQKQVKSILLELFFVVVVSSITAFTASKGITILSTKLIPWSGLIDSVIIGSITALIASLLGTAWMFYCDDLYRSRK